MAKIVEKIEITYEEDSAYNLILNMLRDIGESSEDNFLYTACMNIINDLEDFYQKWID